MLCPKPIFFGRATWTTPFQPKLVGENSNFLLVHRLGCVRSSGLGGRLGRCVGQGTLFVLLHNGALPEYSVSGLIILLTGRLPLTGTSSRNIQMCILAAAKNVAAITSAGSTTKESDR